MNCQRLRFNQQKIQEANPGRPQASEGDRLGPGCRSACTWTDASNKIQRSSKGPKQLQACAAGANYGQDTKRQTPPTLLWSREPKHPGTRERQMHPAHSTPKVWADSLASPPAQALDPPLPAPQTMKQPALPRPASKGKCYLVLLPPAAAGAPAKPCLNFLSGLLSVSIAWGGQEP